MTSTYVNDLRLNEMGTGDASGTWGTITNTNLELIGEALGYGTEGITTNADTHTTEVADGSTDPGRAMYIKYTGTLDSTCTITIQPNTMCRVHFIENATSGSQSIIISQGSGANVTIPNGHVKAVYLDGAGSGAAVTEAFTDLSVSGNLLIDGATPTLTIGDAGAEDTKIVFDGNAKDFYVGLDDSADKLVIGEGSTVGTNNILTITDDTVTIGDGAAADTAIVFDGNAQDFYIGLDDSADDLIIGLGSTVGTTPIISVDENKDVAIPDGGLTITNSDNTTQLALVSTDADANVGPVLELYRNSSSPADNDELARIYFYGENDNDEKIEYGLIRATIVDASDASEDSSMQILTYTAGSQKSRIELLSTETVFNEGSSDIDFRVESNGNANAIFVNGGDDRVTFFNGTTVNAASGTDDGASHYSDGRTDISRASAQPLNLRRRTDDGILQAFYKEASGTVTDVGAISTWSSNIAVGRLNCALLFDDDVNRIKPASVASSGARDNVIDLGDPSHRFNDVWIGGGIHIGGTGDANKLDDYEEGTFTPFITTSGGNYTSGSQDPVGYYTKIGRQVQLELEVSISSSTTISGGSGDFRITGLPFDPVIAAIGNCSTGRVDPPTMGTWQAYQPAGETYLKLRAISDDSDGIETAQAAIIQGNTTPWFTIYLTYTI
jgi:hypothetical protein